MSDSTIVDDNDGNDQKEALIPFQDDIDSPTPTISFSDSKLLLISFLGGILVGACFFFAIFHPKFVGTMERIALQHNMTLKQFQDRVDVVMQEKDECLQDDSDALELAKVRGQLSAQKDCRVDYERLESDFERQRQQIWDLQRQLKEMEDREVDFEREIEGLEQRAQELKAETALREQEHIDQRDIIDRQASELELLAKEKNAFVERISRLTEQRSALNKQIKNFSRKMDEMGTKIAKTESRLHVWQRRTQQREAFLCKEEFGNGPYYVQVSAMPRLANPKTHTFVMELASRRDMPHSVYTFLSLVTYQMYDGGSFQKRRGDDDVLSLSLEGTAPNFQLKRRAVGMDETILLFPEEAVTNFPCDEFSVGFVETGPLLEFYTGPRGIQADQSCFAKVVRGMDSLMALAKLAKAGAAVDVIRVEHLLL